MRTIFLRGLRRRAVQFDVNPIEICCLAAVLILMVVAAGASLASSSSVPACDPPADDEVLVWSFQHGRVSCQYITRQS